VHDGRSILDPVPALLRLYLAYSLLYVPTLSVTNTIAFAN
jgi:hypothetical protein